jgi:hypothetical protein
MVKNLKKHKVYISIDLEDFSHDYNRLFGSQIILKNSNALNKSYERIKDISNKYLDNKKMTFFVTGICARQNPELIKKIHSDGHEIACHYNYHDSIKNQNPEIFRKNLKIAKQSIEEIIGEEILGFRAPYFAIGPNDDWAYEIIAEEFRYDSSYKTSLNFHDAKNEYKKNNRASQLTEFFIFEYKFLFQLKMKSGGTFFRFFPAKWIKSVLMQQVNDGHTPLIYFHPYEFTLNAEFWVPFRYFKHCGIFKGLLAWARQIQWLIIGHRNLDKKLSFILQDFEHQGPMKDLLK